MYFNVLDKVLIGIEITATEPADTRDCMPSDNAHSVRYPHTQLGPLILFRKQWLQCFSKYIPKQN